MSIYFKRKVSLYIVLFVNKTTDIPTTIILFSHTYRTKNIANLYYKYDNSFKITASLNFFNNLEI